MQEAVESFLVSSGLNGTILNVLGLSLSAPLAELVLVVFAFTLAAVLTYLYPPHVAVEVAPVRVRAPHIGTYYEGTEGFYGAIEREVQEMCTEIDEAEIDEAEPELAPLRRFVDNEAKRHQDVTMAYLFYRLQHLERVGPKSAMKTG
jgi:uncharacterized membrane protein